MFKNLKIRNKMLLGFGALSIIILIIGAISYLSMTGINDKKVDLLSAYNASDAIMEAKFDLKSDAQLLLEMIASNDLSEVNSYWKEYLIVNQNFKDYLASIIEIFSSTQWGHEYAKEKSDVVAQMLHVQKVYVDKIEHLANEIYQLIQKSPDINSIRNELHDYDVQINIQLSELITTFEKTESGLVATIVGNAKQKIEGTITRAESTSLVLVIIGLIMSTVIAFVVSNAIVKPIFELKENVEKLGQGELCQQYNYQATDEVGIMAKSLSNMSCNLQEIINGINEGARNILAASTQISAGAQQISQSSNEAAASVEEISASVEEMAANIQQNTDNAKETEKIAGQSAETISKGNESVQIAMASMNEIASKITIINDIAFQTNILALNAAVEAARAGEHGKGFAVVAAEVRKLAEHSKQAAEQIDSLSSKGVKISSEAGSNLAEVVPQIKRTASLVQEISAASIEQASGANQISSSIEQLNQVAQMNASASEELASTAEELNSQAEQLREMISFFKL